MRLVDTHCHLDFPDFKDDTAEVLKRAEDSGVARIIVPGTDISSSRRAVELASKYASVFAAVGIHPHEADKVGPSEIGELRELASGGGNIVAMDAHNLKSR